MSNAVLQVQPSEDEPRDSSAASCIRFSLLNETFAPEYTHQVFPGEFIPGYQPANLDVGEAQPSHASFQHRTTHEVSIEIRLAPSCASCSVTIDSRRKKRELAQQSAPCAKRLKGDEQDEAFAEMGSQGQDSETGDDTDEGNSSRNGVVKPSPHFDESLKDRMSIDDIRERLQAFLPLICSSDGESSHEDSSFLPSPLGTVLAEYSRKGADFCLSLCDGKNCVDYHNNVQKLALFYIESAENVDVFDPAWKVLYLFRKHDVDKYSMVGYMTLFYFESPFRKPVGGMVVRVCQVLVLPPYQRAGQGTTMLHAVFDMADGKYHDKLPGERDIVEINAEDPAPAFATLRIFVDFLRFVEGGRDWFGSGDGDSCLTEATFFAPLKDAEALAVTVVAKTTAKQVQMVYELDKLQQLVQRSSENTAGDRELLEKRFRVMVKQRLNKENREELAACMDKPSVQTLLKSMFDDVFQQYQVILKHFT